MLTFVQPPHLSAYRYIHVSKDVCENSGKKKRKGCGPQIITAKMDCNLKNIVSYLPSILWWLDFSSRWKLGSFGHHETKKNHSIGTTEFFLCTHVHWCGNNKTHQHNLICSLYESPSINTRLSLEGIFWFCSFFKSLACYFLTQSLFSPLVGWHIGLTLYHSVGKPLSPKPEMGNEALAEPLIHPKPQT